MSMRWQWVSQHVGLVTVLVLGIVAVGYAAQVEGDITPMLQGGNAMLEPSQQRGAQPKEQLSMKQAVSEHLLSTENPCTHLVMHLYDCAQDSAQWSSGVQHDNSTAVSMCWAPPSDSSIHREGLLAIRETTLSSKAGDQHSTYRVRAVGRQVKQIHVQYCGRGLHLGHVSLWGDGAYHFEVLRLYQNFSFLNIMSRQDPARISTFTWNLTAPASLPSSNTQALPDIPCIRAPLHAVWLSKLPFDAQLTGLHETDIRTKWPVASPLVLNYNHNVLQWRPLTCRLLRWSEMLSLGCLNDRFVCFAGDSHVRNLYNGYVSTVPSILAGWDEPSLGSQDPDYSNNKTIFESNLAQFMWDPFGNITQLSSFENCTDVVIGTAQWPLSYRAGGVPWTVERYQEVVANRAALLTELKRQGKGALWMGVQGFPWRNSNTGSKPRDWRVQPWLQLYHTVSSRVMLAHGVPQLDVFDMTSAFVDLTVDGCHYPPNGTVGHAMNQVLNHELCSLHTTHRKRKQLAR